MNSERYNFNDLVKKMVVKLQEGVIVNIYTTEGDVNRKYIYDVCKNKESDTVCFDSLFTDGVTSATSDGIEINNSSYVGIISVNRDAKTSDLKSEKLSLFFNLSTFGYFQSYLLSQGYMGLFAQLVNKNTVKGKLENYSPEENGTIIKPSMEEKSYDCTSRTILGSGTSRIRK